MENSNVASKPNGINSKFSNWTKNNPIKFLIFLVLWVVICFKFFGYIFESKGINNSIIANNDWFLEKGNPNSLYDANVCIRFSDIDKGTVEIWEGSTSLSDKACKTIGSFRIDEKENILFIDGLRNINCPWMSNFNGEYRYLLDENREGYNKHMLEKGSIRITHNFDKNR